MKTESVTTGADATEYVRFLLCTGHTYTVLYVSSVPSALTTTGSVLFAEIQIIFWQSVQYYREAPFLYNKIGY